MAEPKLATTCTESDDFHAFLKVVGGYFTTIAKCVITSEGGGTKPSLLKPYQIEFENALPDTCLFQFGFKDVVSKAVATGSWKNAVVGLLPDDIQSLISDLTRLKMRETATADETTDNQKNALDSTIVQALVAYVAEEIMEIHQGFQWSDADGGATEIPNLVQLKIICEGDEDLLKLVHQVGFSLDCGEQILPYAKKASTSKNSDGTKVMDSIQRLERACHKGTAEEVFAILTEELECDVCLAPLPEGCEATSTRLPKVPSLVCAPYFEPSDDGNSNDGAVISRPRGVSPLLVACHAGNVDVVKLLLQRFGSKVNCFVGVDDEIDENQSKDRYSPLYAALFSPVHKKDKKEEDDSNQMEMVRLLLQYGAWADIEVPIRYEDMFGWNVGMRSLLSLAICNGIATPIVLLLLKHMKPDSFNYSKIMKPKMKKSTSPLVTAASEGRVEILQVLLQPPHSLPVEPDYEPDTRYGEIDYYEDGQRVYTALMAAVQSGSVEAVELLLEQGADVNRLYPSRTAVTEYLTPLRKAAQCGHAPIVRVLRSPSVVAPWSKYTNCFTWGNDHSGGEGQVELQDAIQGYKVSAEKRLETVRALVETGAKVSTYLKQLGKGSAPHIPKEWKTLSNEIQKEMAIILLKEHCSNS